MIIVTTPAVAAQKVAARVADMGRKNYLRIVGVVENMSYLVTPMVSTRRCSARAGVRRWPPR